MLIIVQLRYLLIVVPPQPNSQPESVLYEAIVHTQCTSLQEDTLAGASASGYYIVSRVAIKGSGISLLTEVSHLCYIPYATPQNQTRVKLNRVFLPRYCIHARSHDCGFARQQVGTVGISLIHSCAPQIKWRGIWLP